LYPEPELITAAVQGSPYSKESDFEATIRKYK